MPDFELLWRTAPLLLQGLWNTVWIVGLGCILAVLLGLALAVLAQARLPVLRWLVRAYVELVRGVPLLVVLFVIYFGGPSFGLRLDAALSGLIGIGLYGGGYFAEIFRGGLASVPPGQVEAARMLGLPRWHVFLHIRLPQTLRLVTPPSVNQIIILIKESALLSVISVNDLTKNATRIVNETYVIVEPYLAVALLYWLLIELVARFGYRLERRLERQVPGSS